MLGSWWLPNPSEDASDYQLPEHRVSGEVTGDGPWDLTTIGSLLSEEPIPFFGSRATTDMSRLRDMSNTPDAIWGTNAEGECLSLFDLLWLGQSRQSNNPLGGTEKWHVGWYTSGNAWVEPGEVGDHVVVRFDVLDDWAGNHIPADHFVSEDGSFQMPEATLYKGTVGDASITLSLDSRWWPTSGGFLGSRFSSFTIKDETVRLDEIAQKWARPLMILLELLTASPVRMTGTAVRLNSTPPLNRPLLVDLYPNLRQPKEESHIPRKHWEMLATRVDLEERGLAFPDLIRRFFALYRDQKHKTALGLLCYSQSRILDKSADSELLTAFKAMELYHSAEVGGTDIPPPEHRKRIDAVVEGAPEEWQAWARRNLEDRNGKSLTTQLQEIMDLSSATGIRLDEAWPNFCREMADNRNKAAHGRSTTIPSLGLRCHAGAVGLRWLLRHLYLLKLGISETNADDLIQNASVFQQEMSHLAKWYRSIGD